MDESARQWLDKIEAHVLEFHTDFTKSSVELTTKMDMVLTNQKDLEQRVRTSEEYIHRQEGINGDNDRKSNRNLALVGAMQVVVVVLAFVGNHFIK